MPTISIVIPVFNEEGSLAQLHKEISVVAEANKYEVEIIFVDDGSDDSSWKVMTDLAQQDSRIQCLRFRRNFGKAAGLRAGAVASTGELIITMDADLQDDPDEIPNLISKLDEGYDLVSGWKQVRNDPVGKTLPSKVFNLSLIQI